MSIQVAVGAIVFSGGGGGGGAGWNSSLELRTRKNDQVDGSVVSWGVISRDDVDSQGPYTTLWAILEFGFHY